MVPDLISLITKFNPIKIYSKTCLKWQRGPGWLNELGSWITLQLIQAYH